MSAVKIIFKRSSLLGKRPIGSNLEAGEIGLNTNSNDPGLFFEVNDGSVVKAGPTAYLPEAPTQNPALGELWVDTDTKAMRIGTAAQKWQTVAAPFLGGTEGLTVFVAPEFENATDSLANDGQTVPFITINRAVLEVTKNIIRDTISGVSLGNNQYLIVLAPGRHCVVNGPGEPVSTFSTDFSSDYTTVTQAKLQQFNTETGGLILPRGVSIVGMDLKKCELHPTYVPKYTYPGYPIPYRQDTVGGPVYQNEPRTSLLKWTGNTYLTQFCCTDKVELRTVTEVTTAENGAAVFRSNRPHGLDYNDYLQVTYTVSADRAGASFSTGQYYCNPIDAYTFELALLNWDDSSVVPIYASELPSSFVAINAQPSAKFRVENIYPYFIPQGTDPYELSNYSHHRLSVLANASITDLNNFYIKVQTAFAEFFGYKVDRNLADPSEYDIVASTASPYPNNIESNSTSNSSPYQNMVNHRSNYGMANGYYDGNLVSGFKSVIINSSTAVLLQKDPVAYEIYADGNQNWTTLTELARQRISTTTPITSVPKDVQLQILNETSVQNIRYYYRSLLLENGQSIGLADPETDFRHFGFKAIGPNSFVQAQSTYTIGAAIAVWAQEGAIISLTNATTNFGSVAFEADGFAGINSLGGANEVNKGFLQTGIVRPLALTEKQVVSDLQKETFSLGSRVVHVAPDPNDSTAQLIYLAAPFNPATLLPYSLAPDSALFVEDATCTYRGFFVNDGNPTCILSESDSVLNPYAKGGAILRLRRSDSNIPDGPASETCLSSPYIRRFIDPRTPAQRSYGFLTQSTTTTAQSPQLGSVLRLNQTGQKLSDSLKRNYQFDPGQFGGMSQIFTVDLVETQAYNQSVNFNNKVSDSAQSTGYTIYVSLTDASQPWVQSLTDGDDVTFPIRYPQGSYVTFQNQNYYAAENSEWKALYYNTGFDPLNGPVNVSPNKEDSSFVISSVLQRQEPVFDTWQGAVPDPYLAYYETIPDEWKQNLTYMRGCVTPYAEFGTDKVFDYDDSTTGMGIIYTNSPLPAVTLTTADSVIVQQGVPLSSPYVSASARTFGRPTLMSLRLLGVSKIMNPKNGLSVVRLVNSDIDGSEYVRVISITSNFITVIRNYYPGDGDIPDIWPAGTVVEPCVLGCNPEPETYDPAWSITKNTVFRYYELMGYAPDLIAPYLLPQYSGERILLNTDIALSPVGGYASRTAAWPIEFNNPSTILANTHTWQYVGYFDYSRGLPKYQTNELPRKLQFDYLSTVSWGGRLTVVGADQHGSIVLQGPLREAITGNFYDYNNPVRNFDDKLSPVTPEPIDTYPSPVLMYSADDISGQFDGIQTEFDLTAGGINIPSSQLTEAGIFVTLGGAMQIPNEAYVLDRVGGVIIPTIIFSAPPPAGASCDIRILTSDDGNTTMEVLTYAASPAFDGSTSNFLLTPGDTGLDNSNAFFFLGGVPQVPLISGYPDPSYTISTTNIESTLTFLGDPPLEGLTFDLRAAVSGPLYRNAKYPIVNVIPIDDISGFFDNILTSFPLYVDNQPVNPSFVNAENMFVSLGAVIQIPHNVAGNPLSGNAYTVQVNPVTKLLEITFAEAPRIGYSCVMQAVSPEPANFIICPLPAAIDNRAIVSGNGVYVNERNEIIRIDPDLIG